MTLLSISYPSGSFSRFGNMSSITRNELDLMPMRFKSEESFPRDTRAYLAYPDETRHRSRASLQVAESSAVKADRLWRKRRLKPLANSAPSAAVISRRNFCRFSRRMYNGPPPLFISNRFSVLYALLSHLLRSTSDERCSRRCLARRLSFFSRARTSERRKPPSPSERKIAHRVLRVTVTIAFYEKKA